MVNFTKINLALNGEFYSKRINKSFIIIDQSFSNSSNSSVLMKSKVQGVKQHVNPLRKKKNGWTICIAVKKI